MSETSEKICKSTFHLKITLQNVIFFYMDVSKKIQDIARIFSHKVKKILYILKIDQGKSLISQENIVKHDY